MSPCPKGSRDAAELSNRARYIVIHPGMEALRGEQQDRPAASKQQTYIQSLFRDLPGAKELLEYEGYYDASTQASANAFTRQVREDFAESTSRLENHLDYVSHRPGVQVDGEHGLWHVGDKVRNPPQTAREVAKHTDSTWTPAVAIRREDTERLGYGDAEN